MSYQNYDETLDRLLIAGEPGGASRPVWCMEQGKLDAVPEEHRAWLDNTGFRGEAGTVATLPGNDGAIAGAVLGLGKAGGPWDALLPGALPGALPAGEYHFASPDIDAEKAALAWLMGAYRFARYKVDDGWQPRVLGWANGRGRDAVVAQARAVYLGRDLINTPACDLGPEELAAAAAEIGDAHGAAVSVIKGDDLLSENFPMIHAVGRASDRAPRLIDLTWGGNEGPKVTLVGKGICFDTGGLNLKPGRSMALMKKDMGGAATVLSLASMIMQAGLPVRLRVLIPAAENNVSANSFRPGDILKSRDGMTVEIGNTDAEGRLVLADALSLADEESPDYLISIATLTGAARVALGPDLPPLYTDDDAFADSLVAAADQVADPLWRMPFWAPYDALLASKIADVNHISDGAFAGSITAALFLRRFVRQAACYAHLDIYGWVPRAQPARPEGGEPQAARALFGMFAKSHGS